MAGKPHSLPTACSPAEWAALLRKLDREQPDYTT